MEGLRRADQADSAAAPSLGAVVQPRKKLQGPQARHEEIRAGLNRHEPRQRGGAQSEWLGRDRHVARRLVFPVVVAGDWILVVVEPAEARVVAPCLLHELELASNARVDAKEVNAARAAILCQREQ